MPDAYRTTWPSALLDVAAAVTKLSPDADKLQPLFITLDPRRDPPAVMGNYIQSFDSRIVGLTGTPQQIAAVAQEYGAYSNLVRAGPRAEDYVMDHSTYLYLMTLKANSCAVLTPTREAAHRQRGAPRHANH